MMHTFAGLGCKLSPSEGCHVESHRDEGHDAADVKSQMDILCSEVEEIAADKRDIVAQKRIIFE
jgi:hypothetical protein